MQCGTWARTRSAEVRRTTGQGQKGWRGGHRGLAQRGQLQTGAMLRSVHEWQRDRTEAVLRAAAENGPWARLDEAGLSGRRRAPRGRRTAGRRRPPERWRRLPQGRRRPAGRRPAGRRPAARRWRRRARRRRRLQPEALWIHGCALPHKRLHGVGHAAGLPTACVAHACGAGTHRQQLGQGSGLGLATPPPCLPRHSMPVGGRRASKNPQQQQQPRGCRCAWHTHSSSPAAAADRCSTSPHQR